MNIEKKNLIDKIADKLFSHEDNFGLNPFIANHYYQVKDTEIINEYNAVYDKLRNNKLVIKSLRKIINVNDFEEHTNNVLREKIKELKYENGTAIAVLKLLRKRGNLSMFEYLINVKNNNEKGYYIEAESPEEAVKKAVEFFLEDEDNSCNFSKIEVEIVSYDEIDEEELEEEDIEELDEDEEDIETINFNIQINPIRNIKDLEEKSKEITGN